MTPSIWQIALVVLVIVLLFGRGRISEFMSDFARGIKSFKSGLQDDSNDQNQEEKKQNNTQNNTKESRPKE